MELIYEELGKEAEPGVTKLEKLVQQLVDEALRNQRWAICEIADRMAPKPKRVEVVERRGADQPPDLSMLTDRELELLDEIYSKVEAGRE